MTLLALQHYNRRALLAAQATRLICYFAQFAETEFESFRTASKGKGASAGDLCFPYKQREHSSEGLPVTAPCLGNSKWYHQTLSSPITCHTGCGTQLLRPGPRPLQHHFINELHPVLQSSPAFFCPATLGTCLQTLSGVAAAVDASQFKPDVSKRRPGRLTVVALSRLVYRKGIDLLVVIIPEMCHRHPQVDFVIGRASSWMIKAWTAACTSPQQPRFLAAPGLHCTHSCCAACRWQMECHDSRGSFAVRMP